MICWLRGSVARCFQPFLALLAHLRRHLSMFDHQDISLLRLIEGIRMQIEAAFLFRLHDFNRYAMMVGIRILANAGHLPRDFDIRSTGPDAEVIAFDLLDN